MHPYAFYLFISEIELLYNYQTHTNAQKLVQGIELEKIVYKQKLFPRT